MNLLYKYSSFKLFLISMLGAVFITYPNIASLPWELSFLDESKHSSHILFFIARYIFFSVLIWILIRYNLYKIKTPLFQKRLLYTFLIAAVAYLIYIGISFLIRFKSDCFTGTLLFQFFVAWIFCTFAGYVSVLSSEKRRKEQEIEQLKIENLQSQCDALANQINPHFFFNSLNSLAALVRKNDNKNTLLFLNKLSDVFRYTLQSDKKSLVTLKEELDFMQAFRYMLEVRFANKLVFDIDINQESMELKLPVLSLLPVIDNIVVHNTIDSEHIMTITIRINEQAELVVSNPIYPKLTPPDTNGTGIRNLENRFSLLMDKQVRIENNTKIFRIFMPLKT
ncbi:MAG: histidine kinase [Bacteroidales bacterium]|nr:histidine kinase [Bacteroidales bacterium]